MILSLRTSLLMEIESHNLFSDMNVGSPIIQLSLNRVKSTSKTLRTLASRSMYGTWVGGSCQPSCKVAEQYLPFEIHALKLQLL